MGPTNRRLHIAMPALPRPDSVALRGTQNVSPCSSQADLRCRQTDSIARSHLFSPNSAGCAAGCPEHVLLTLQILDLCTTIVRGEKNLKIKIKICHLIHSVNSQISNSPIPSQISPIRTRRRTMVLKPPLPRSPSSPKWQRGGTGQSASALPCKAKQRDHIPSPTNQCATASPLSLPRARVSIVHEERKQPSLSCAMKNTARLGILLWPASKK